MPITLYIQERSGDYNLDQEIPDLEKAHALIALIKKSQGYWQDGKVIVMSGYGEALVYSWMNEGTVFVPWHRIDRIEIRSDEA